MTKDQEALKLKKAEKKAWQRANKGVLKQLPTKAEDGKAEEGKAEDGKAEDRRGEP